MRALPLGVMLALAVGGAASAKTARSCAAQWSATSRGAAHGSQSRRQFMTTCQAAGVPGGAPHPVSPGGENRPR